MTDANVYNEEQYQSVIQSVDEKHETAEKRQ